MSEIENEPSEQDLKDVLSRFLRHVVGFAIRYRYRVRDGKVDAEGVLESHVHFGVISLFVVEYAGQWWLATAGHVLTDFLPKIKSGAVEIVQRSLVDCFGEGAQFSMPIPYDLFAEPTKHAYDKARGLDYCLVPVTDLVRRNLEANKILPLQVNWQRGLSIDDFAGFGIVGIPDESASGDTTRFALGSGGSAKPAFVPLRHKELRVRDGFPEFVMNIVDMGSQKSIVGMSGGPVLGLRNDDSGSLVYEVVAIQSRWNEVDKVFACPIAVAFAALRASFESQV